MANNINELRSALSDMGSGIASAPPTPRMETRRVFSLSINKCLNGYILNVGCQTVVFETSEKLLSELKRYIDNQSEVEKEYLAKAGLDKAGLRL